MNDGEQFPQEQQGEPDGNNGTDDTQNDAQNVEDGRALFRLLDADNELVLVIVAVNKRHSAVVIIVKPALFIWRIFLCRKFYHFESKIQSN